MSLDKPPFDEIAHDQSTQNRVTVSRVAEHDAAVVLRYEPAVRRFCRSRTRTPEDAEDATQDTFLRFLRRSEQKIRNNEAWLITAASRACADISRRNQRDDRHRSGSADDDCFTPNGGMPFGSGLNNDPATLTVEHLTVAALLRRMSARERAVVTHLYLMGARSDQVAKFLGITPEHVRVIAMRARRHARAILRDMEYVPTS